MEAAPRILLVEDTDDDVFLFMRALRSSKMEIAVDHVADGEAAIDYLRKCGLERPVPENASSPLVLLDINLPVFNGFEVLEWIRANPGILRGTCVIFLTTSDAPEDRQA